MAETSLTTTPGSGTQSTTQSPQTASPANVSNTAASSVQPGTASDLLNHGSSGMALTPTVLPTASLTPGVAQVAQTAPQASHHRHINGGLMAISIALFVLAIMLFWFTSRSVKNTTNNYK